MGIGALQAKARGVISRLFLEPFAHKPGLGVGQDVPRVLTVRDRLGSPGRADRYVQAPGSPARHARTGARLDMRPHVPGGVRPGDIVLRQGSRFMAALSGIVTTLAEILRTGRLRIFRSPVSHAGLVVRDRAGALQVVHMVTLQPPPELAARLGWRRWLSGTILRKDSLDRFFNPRRNPFTRAIVMRPADRNLAARAAANALRFYDTQVGPAGVRPWYSKIPLCLAPGRRGGVCSTFVDAAYERAFAQPLRLPVTPFHFMLAPTARKVGDREIVTVQALGGAVLDGATAATGRGPGTAIASRVCLASVKRGGFRGRPL